MSAFTDDPMDEREPDDLPPAAQVLPVTLDDCQVDACNDGTLAISFGNQVIEIGARSAKAWFRLFVEAGRAAEVWLELEEYASKPREIDWFEEAKTVLGLAGSLG